MRNPFQVDAANGLVRPARQCPSANCDDRPPDVRPELIVLHGISLPPGEYGGPHIEALFTNRLDFGAHPYFEGLRELEVSAHLLIRRDGELVQFVPLTMRAWHAGESKFRQQNRCNDYSIGIELEGSDDTPYADIQYGTLAGLLPAVMRAWPNLRVRDIAAHSDISPGRKTDPGPAFDWLRLYDALT